MKKKKNLKSRGKNIYTCLVPEGKYTARSLIGLGWEIFKHKFSHLLFDGKWRH